jgi:hypothetical protein
MIVVDGQVKEMCSPTGNSVLAEWSGAIHTVAYKNTLFHVEKYGN